jgi:pyridoxine 5'-phosphate synthase PdxJ
LPGLREVNIGHDIVALAVFIGLEKAVRTFLQILEKAAYGVSGESDT